MENPFKFEEGLFLKYKKEIAMAVGSMLVLVSVVNFVPGNGGRIETEGGQSGYAAAFRNEESNAYQVVIGGEAVGYVDYMEIGDNAFEAASGLLVEELGYDPEQEPDMQLVEAYSRRNDFLSVEALAVLIKDNILTNLENPRELAYVMKIGDSFTVAVRTEEEIKEVLERAQSLYISEDTTVEVSLGSDSRNSLVMTPQVSLAKAPGEARNFTTASQQPEGGKTVEIELAADVLVVQDYVPAGDIKDLDEATEMVTKEHEEAVTYAIEQGDVLGLVAQEHGMSLNELYQLNPGLESRQNKIQIGEEVVVMVPEKDLKVMTKEEVVYTESIKKETVYKKDSSTYVGNEKVIDEGADGVLQITATVTKVNGEAVEKEITDETVLEEPRDKVISKGTKPLPVKGATGNYVYPLDSFRITSYFGPRWGSYHTGVDFAAPYGTPVHASDGGTVVFSGWRSSYGYVVDIDHGNGVLTRYAHNSKLLVSVGQRVAKYETIAKVGSTGRSTGPHVHFEIRFNGTAANPMKYF